VAAAWAVIPPTGDRDGVTEIYVSAATSLVDALTELGGRFERERGGSVRVRFDFASSGMLRKKIEAGVSADAFVSASSHHMDALADGGFVSAGTRRDLLRNSLVCVVAASSDLRLTAPGDLAGTDIHRVAIADPAHAPAGMYAAEALRKLGVWEGLKRRLVHCPDVRAALMQVRSGAVNAAIVYLSDARSAPDVRVTLSLPPESYSPIVYPACVLGRSQRSEQAREFIRFLASAEATEVFRAHGLTPVAAGQGGGDVD